MFSFPVFQLFILSLAQMKFQLLTSSNMRCILQTKLTIVAKGRNPTQFALCSFILYQYFQCCLGYKQQNQFLKFVGHIWIPACRRRFLS